mmetsp:Transcript_51803/g.125040  ORF Transcript_51803/g.125040 Transcript_51803/m.125040 type:complete len:84 (-) Transcript_51803:1592-1843(-)
MDSLSQGMLYMIPSLADAAIKWDTSTILIRSFIHSPTHDHDVFRGHRRHQSNSYRSIKSSSFGTVRPSRLPKLERIISDNISP